MNNIYKLKEMNITFNHIGEEFASKIMQEEYSFSQLIKYSNLFEKYHKGEKAGKFVCLDFAQLYYLAEMDMHFGQIIMVMYLTLENKIKCLFLNHAEQYCDTQFLLKEYYDSEREFLDNTYTSENYDAIQDMNIQNGVEQLSLPDFVEIIQFGTLERLIHFFYKKYAIEIYNSNCAPFERNLDAVRRIRNIVAHNNSLLTKIIFRTENKNVHVAAFLGKQGVKHRTLDTNLSKAIINDLCSFFETYRMFICNSDDILNSIDVFEQKYILSRIDTLKKNETFNSVYMFLKIAIKKILKNY